MEKIIKISDPPQALDRFLYFSVLFTVFTIPIYNSFTSVGLGLSILFFILKTLHDRKRPIFFIDLMFFAFLILLALLSFINTPDMAASFKYLKKFVLHFFLYLAVFQCATNRHYLIGIVFFLLASAAISSIDGLYQYFSGIDWFSSRPVMEYPHLGIRRITGPLHQAGSFGIFLGFVIPLALSLFLSTKNNIVKYCSGFSVLIITCAIFLTFAPGAAGGLFISLMILSILYKKPKPILIFILILAAAWFFLPQALTQWPDGSLFTSIRGRAIMWGTSLHIFNEHPLIGSGVGSFAANYNIFCLPGAPHCGGESPYAHNQYVHILVEYGISGFLFFFYCVSYLILKGWKLCSSAGHDGINKGLLIGLVASMAAYLTHGMFESSIYTYHGSLLFWTGLGLLRAGIIQNNT